MSTTIAVGKPLLLSRILLFLSTARQPRYLSLPDVRNRLRRLREDCRITCARLGGQPQGKTAPHRAKPLTIFPRTLRAPLRPVGIYAEPCPRTWR